MKKKPSSSKKSPNKPTLEKILINALDDLKAQNVMALDVSSLTDVFDIMIIASGSSNRQVRAIAQHAAEEAKKHGMAAMGIEGLDAGEWVLADFGDIVLHVMQPEIREFYDLERLWQSAEKPAAAKPAPKKETAAKKSSPAKTAPVLEAEFTSQSDAAKARKSPGKPKAVPVTGTKKTTAKSTPAKAGVYAKTGTKKRAAPTLATPKKPAATKTAATAKPATKRASTVKKTTARKPGSV